MSHQFKAGDSVVCVDCKDFCDLTHGKTYTVLGDWIDGNRIVITDDHGDKAFPFAHRFRLAPSLEGKRQGKQTGQLILAHLMDLHTESLRRHLLELSRRLDVLESRPSTRAEPSETQHKWERGVGGIGWWCKVCRICGGSEQEEPKCSTPCVGHSLVIDAFGPSPDPTMRERAEKYATGLVIQSCPGEPLLIPYTGPFESVSSGLKSQNNNHLLVNIRRAIVNALITFASAEMEKVKAENERLEKDCHILSRDYADAERRVAKLESRLSTLTAERDALKARLDQQERINKAMAQTLEDVKMRDRVNAHQVANTPPTQGDEGFEEWATNAAINLTETIRHASHDALKRSLIRSSLIEAHHRATNAERERIVEIANTARQKALKRANYGAAHMAREIAQATLTPSEPSP